MHHTGVWITALSLKDCLACMPSVWIFRSLWASLSLLLLCLNCWLIKMKFYHSCDLWIKSSSEHLYCLVWKDVWYISFISVGILICQSRCPLYFWTVSLIRCNLNPLGPRTDIPSVSLSYVWIAVRLNCYSLSELLMSFACLYLFSYLCSDTVVVFCLKGTVQRKTKGGQTIHQSICLA